MVGRTRLRQLPGVPSDLPANQRAFFDAVKQAIEVGEGERGDPMDRKLTARDLVDAGLAKIRIGRANLSGLSGGSLIEPNEPLPNLTVPPRVNEFTGEGAATRVVLSWGAPQYANHGHVEIARSPSQDFGQATTIGTETARVYVDVTGGGFTGYYWARNISSPGGVAGQWTGPVKGVTTPDFEYVQNSLSSTEWQADTAYSLFNAVAPTTDVVVNGVLIRLIATTAGTTGSSEPNWSSLSALGETITDNEVVWQAVEVGKIPLFIDPVSGLVVIEGAAMKEASIGALSVEDAFLDNLTVDKGVLNYALIDVGDIFNLNIGDVIQSDNYIAGTQGWRAQKGGAMELNDGLVVNALAIIDKAQIKEAAVDTLELRDQAVTFPVSSYTADSVSISSSWTQYQDVTIETTGAPVLVTISFISIDDLWNVGTQGTWYGHVRAKLNGSVLFDFGQFAQAHVDVGSVYAVYYGTGPGGFSHQFKTTPPEGVNTFAFDVMSSIPGHIIKNRGISVIEVKR